MKKIKEIKRIVKDNIYQIKISEFVPNGGFPDLENIEVEVYNSSIKNGVEVIDLGIICLEKEADFCDMFGNDTYHKLQKQLIINANSIVLK